MARRDERLDLEPRTVAVFLAAFVVLTAITGLLRSAPRAFTAVAVGGLLALALNPVVDAAERRVRNRSLAVAAVFTTFAVVVAAMAAVLVPPAVEQARELGTDLPRVVSQLTDLPVVG